MSGEESIYKTLFEHSRQGMVLQQGEKILLVNQSFADMVGYTLDELSSFSADQALNLFNLPDRTTAVTSLDNLQAGKELIKSQECRFKRQNGETGWCSVTLSRVEFEGQFAILGVYEDITESKNAQDALARGRTLLASTLDVLPVGVCLTDESGYYRLMNDAYCAIYEYKKEEMLGQHYSVIMPPDQIDLANAHYARLLTGDVGIPVERKRQRKDGSIIYIEAANALVEGVDGQKMVITTVRNITERKRGEEIIRLRLRLMEFVANHSLGELLQKALDEIGELTGSPIGFYHFVEADQKTLSLQAWSTRTLEEFCQAGGRQGLHYPIEEAGVWTDCIHQRKPVIHNEYAALTHRKGLPEGHAEVVRELVVPTMRENQVVAILGVGNKPSDYNEQDAELVSYIADLVWSIVEEKKADEKIRELNAKLEHLAMNDELTGLPNRRAFFLQGVKEINRAQRHNTSLSLLMLDLDDFKKINDTYGHDVGDLALQRFSQILSTSIREIDMVARIGGEEFSCLLPNTNQKEAINLAERLRAAVERESFHVHDKVISLTVSIGGASYGKNLSSLDAIIKQADNCLYQAKHQGRNRVVYID